MYKFFLLFLSLISLSLEIFSQCFPDETFVPVGTNYGLSPDSLATGYINQEYNQDLTFFLPTDTLVDVFITGPQGLQGIQGPQGIQGLLNI
mgnify:CR=1 FL=1